MNRIAESELIINSRGAVYHLDCRSEEIAGTIITVGDPDRVKEVSKYFDSIEYRNQHRKFVTHTGYSGKKRVSVVSTGIGTDNIDIVLNELDALVNIDFETREIKSRGSYVELSPARVMVRLCQSPNNQRSDTSTECSSDIHPSLCHFTKSQFTCLN